MIDLIETYQENTVVTNYNTAIADYIMIIIALTIIFIIYALILAKLFKLSFYGKPYAYPAFITLGVIGLLTLIYLLYHPDLIPTKLPRNNETTTTTKTLINNEISEDKYEIVLSKDHKYLILKQKNNSNVKFKYTIKDNGNTFDVNNNILEIKDETKNDFVILVPGLSHSNIVTIPKDKFKIKKETVQNNEKDYKSIKKPII